MQSSMSLLAITGALMAGAMSLVRAFYSLHVTRLLCHEIMALRPRSAWDWVRWFYCAGADGLAGYLYCGAFCVLGIESAGRVISDLSGGENITFRPSADES